jgi:hypothetical protein
MAGRTSLPVDRELRRLLRHGTFAEALHHALNVRGLSLERVQYHLAERDVRVSRAALSYWRHGRSRPERAESLRAVRALEEVLDLPAETLVSMLGPPRPRGRAVRPAGALDRRRLWPAHSSLLAAMDAPPDGQLAYLDIHEHVLVDENRQLAAVRTRLVVEARADRVDRCVIYLWTEEPSKPQLTGLRYCRFGRSRSDEESGAVVTELMLDQRLAVGERSVVEFEWIFPPGPELTFYHRRFTRPSRQFVLQVEFAGDVPANCVPFRQLTMESPRQLDRPLWIGASETAHLVVVDPRPGIIGLSWQWD